MRIISGQWGGRKIKPPAKIPFTRPTTDIAKEGLFNILQNRMSFDGIHTLDLFGGTGAISYELASRGAAFLTVVEKNNTMASFIQTNMQQLGAQPNQFQILKQDVFSFLNSCTEKYHFIFAGPPYALDNIDDLPTIIVAQKMILSEGYFVLEHTPRNNYQKFKGYQFERNYGTTIFSFFTTDDAD
ncbi:RsmD family RNA methyltransferase [Hydrotalea sp.]|uniref:RsmD family RNA methyltransferase n=1 Tax=Hydrotalea sp. TaxID=2881279 RepID=UPI002612526D|nr:RsmD family RNA methyltransferase [Hydrotalea sp.]